MGTLKEDLAGIDTIEDKVVKNKVARFAYTEKAYKDNDANGVEEYDVNKEQNIPIGSASVMKVNETVLNRGYRAQASSITRMLMNHFLGRLSYNLNKVNDVVSSFIKTVKNYLGSANGIATLDETGRIPYSQLPESTMEFMGTWDASTNTPTLTDGTGRNGNFYVVSVAGTQTFGGVAISFNVNDRIIYNGATASWTKLSSGDVRTVNSIKPDATGNITLDAPDVNAVKTINHRSPQEGTGNINLESLSINGQFFNGSAPVSVDTMKVIYGGTGATTAKGAQKALLSDMQTETTPMDDSTEFVMKYGTPTDKTGAIFKRSATLVWSYIKGKISSVLGLTATAYGGKAATAGTADKTVNDITIEIPYVDESGQYVIPFGNILEPTSTAINSPYNWDITGFFSVIRPTGHNGSHLYFEAGHGYSHDWTTYVYLDKMEFRGVSTSIQAFQYEGKWWLGLYIFASSQGYSGKMTITYRRGLPATPTCILYNSKSNGIANKEIYDSIQDIPSSWWKTRTIDNPTTFTKDITAPSIKATNGFIGNLTGTASKVQNALTINGQSYDGSSALNISIQEGAYDHIVHDNASLLEWANCTDGSMKKVLVKSGTYNMTKGVNLSNAGTGYVLAEQGAKIESHVPIAFTASSGKTTIHNLKVVCSPNEDNMCAFSANNTENLILYDCAASYSTYTSIAYGNLFVLCTCYNCHYSFISVSTNSSIAMNVFYQCKCYNCTCKQTIEANSKLGILFDEYSRFYMYCHCVSCTAELETLRNLQTSSHYFACYDACNECVGCSATINIKSLSLTVPSKHYGFRNCTHLTSCEEVHTTGYSNLIGLRACSFISSTKATSGESNTHVGNSCEIGK